MRPENVNPTDWTEQEVIFNDPDEGYSAIWGKYKGSFALGTRWDGLDEDRGYPGQGSYPLWFIEPNYLRLPILQQLLIVSLRENLQNPVGEQYSEKILSTIEEVIALGA